MIWPFRRRGGALPADLELRLSASNARPADAGLARLQEDRFVVVDVESTGLDLRRDRLIAIGAVAVEGARIRLADSFEVVLRQQAESARANILVHGIGGQAQRAGVDPPEALADFLDYVGRSPLVAFHVPFDETMIRRAMREHAGMAFKRTWVDLADVLPALLPGLARRHRALDEWAGHFGIINHARHNALADALVTAQLFVAALPIAATRDAQRYKDLRDLERAQRWLKRGF